VAAASSGMVGSTISIPCGLGSAEDGVTALLAAFS